MLLLLLLSMFQSCTEKNIFEEVNNDGTFLKRQNTITCNALHAYQVDFVEGTSESKKADLRNIYVNTLNECWTKESLDSEIWYVDEVLYHSKCPSCVKPVANDDDEIEIIVIVSDLIIYIKLIE